MSFISRKMNKCITNIRRTKSSSWQWFDEKSERKNSWKWSIYNDNSELSNEFSDGSVIYDIMTEKFGYKKLCAR